VSSSGAFSRADRLLSRRDFQAVFARPRRSRDAFFTLLFCHNELGRPRLGLAISRRRVPRAVDRNRLKRQVRESFRHARPGLPAVDIVVMAGPEAAAASAGALRASLARHWQRVAAKTQSAEEGGDRADG